LAHYIDIKFQWQLWSKLPQHTNIKWLPVLHRSLSQEITTHTELSAKFQVLLPAQKNSKAWITSARLITKKELVSELMFSSYEHEKYEKHKYQIWMSIMKQIGSKHSYQVSILKLAQYAKLLNKTRVIWMMNSNFIVSNFNWNWLKGNKTGYNKNQSLREVFHFPLNSVLYHH